MFSLLRGILTELLIKPVYSFQSLCLLWLWQELLQSVGEVADDKFGRKVLLYLLQPRDPLHFHPSIVQILSQGDNNRHRSASTLLLCCSSSSCCFIICWSSIITGPLYWGQYCFALASVVVVCNTPRRACRRLHPRRPGDDVMPPPVQL